MCVCFVFFCFHFLCSSSESYCTEIHSVQGKWYRWLERKWFTSQQHRIQYILKFLLKCAHAFCRKFISALIHYCMETIIKLKPLWECFHGIWQALKRARKKEKENRDADREIQIRSCRTKWNSAHFKRATATKWALLNWWERIVVSALRSHLLLIWHLHGIHFFLPLALWFWYRSTCGKLNKLKNEESNVISQQTADTVKWNGRWWIPVDYYYFLWKLLNHFMSWIWNIYFIKLKKKNNKNKTDDRKCIKIRAFDSDFAYSY